MLTPKAAINALRTCLRRHRSTYGLTVTLRKPHNPVSVATNSNDSPRPYAYYDALVRDARSSSRFWEASRALGVMAQRRHLGLTDG